MAKCPAHPVQLIDQVKDDANALVVDPEVALQIVDQLRPRDVSLAEMLPFIFVDPTPANRPQPRPPALRLQGERDQEIRDDPCSCPAVAAELSPRSECHWLMNCSSSGSGVAGSDTESFTYSSPRLPSRRGSALALEPKHATTVRPLGNCHADGSVRGRHIDLTAEHGRAKRDRQLQADVIVITGK